MESNSGPNSDSRIPPGNPKQFVAVQYLRAVAAYIVIGIHLQEQLERMGWTSGLFDFGSAGVDIFFVISGFVMWHTTQRPISTGQFYYRRIVRIVPLYWLLTSAMLAVLIVAPTLLNSAAYDWKHIIASYFFMAQPHPVLPDAMFPLLVAGWTLNYEMYFYAIFGLMLPLPRLWRLAGLVGLFGALAVFHLATDPGVGALAFYTDPILLEFAAGVLLGYVVERGATLRPVVGWLLAIVGAVLIVQHFDTVRIVRDGLGAILVVTGIVLAETRWACPRFALPTLLGEASYSLYLSHGLILAALLKLFAITVGFAALWTPWLFVTLALATTTAAAILLYHWFEKPSIALFRARFRSPARVLRNW